MVKPDPAPIETSATWLKRNLKTQEPVLAQLEAAESCMWMPGRRGSTMARCLLICRD